MKLIYKGDVYELTRKEVDGMLQVLKKHLPKCIYAVEDEKNDIIEMIFKRYKYTKSMNKAVERYVEKGFRVYFNS